MAEKPQGYIVTGYNRRYLSRKMRWVRHRGRPERAWVHTKESLAMGGDWMKNAEAVYPAQYDPETTFAEIMGDPIPFQTFFVQASTVSA